MRRVYLLYALSGLLSLGYQVSWFRIFVDRFGSTNLTFALVVANFIGGLGAGSLASARVVPWLGRIMRVEDGLRRYGLLELLVSLSAAITLVVAWMPTGVLESFPYELAGSLHRPSRILMLIHGAISILCIFVPCFFMGATFPLLCQIYSENSRFPAALYGWNTLGAALGILLAEFVAIPYLGHDLSFALMTVGNFALAAAFLLPRAPKPVTPRRPVRPAAVDGRQREMVLSNGLAAAITAGLLTGAFEADVLRRLQFLDCRTGAALSCISFWAVLAIFAASWMIRLFQKASLSHVKIAYVAALVLTVALARGAYPLRDRVSASDVTAVLRNLPRDSTGLGVDYQVFFFSYGPASLLKFTGLFVFPAFLLLSLLLPLLCNEFQRSRRHLGLIYGSNTLSFCLGLIAFTSLAPRVDSFYSLRLFPFVGGVLVLFLCTIRSHRPLRFWQPAAALGLLVIAVVFTPTGVGKDLLPANSSPVLYPIRALRSNGAYTTYVVSEPTGDLLFFDSHSMSGCNLPSQQYMRLMAHFPLLAHPDPRRALLICFGVGNTASAIAAHGSIQQIDVVDLNDQVLATAGEFRSINGNVLEDSRVRQFHDDGRRFLSVPGISYDLITSEPPPPLFGGMHRLYSREYYEAVRDRLTPDGLMTQWLPIDQMPKVAVDRAIATFISVFSECILFVGSDTNYILMGSKSQIDLRRVESRWGRNTGAADLHRFGITKPLDLLARIVKGHRSLKREYETQELISDQGLGFSHTAIDPANPSRITYDPLAVIAESTTTTLDCAEELRSVILHLGRLQGIVPDFPVSALTSVPAHTSVGVGLRDADWLGIQRCVKVGGQKVDSGDPMAAVVIWARAMQLGSGQLPHVLQLLGPALSTVGKHDASLQAWQQLQTLSPGRTLPHWGAARALVRLGRPSIAVDEFRRALTFDAMDLDSAAIHRELADALAGLGRWSEAGAAYDQVLIRLPSDESAQRGRERALRELAR